MTRDTQKPPRNRDQELPPRKRDSIEHTTPPERGQGERERNAALPEEETYEPDLRVRVRRHIDRVPGPRLHPRSQGRSVPPAAVKAADVSAETAVREADPRSAIVDEAGE